MDFVLSIAPIPIVLLLVASLLLTISVRLFARGPAGEVGPLIALHGPQLVASCSALVVLAWWLVWYAVELMLTGSEAVIATHRVVYIAIALIGPITLSAVLLGTLRARPGPAYGLFFVVPAVTIGLLVPSPVSDWLWKPAGVESLGGLSVARIDVGWWYHVHTVYSYGCLGLAYGILVWRTAAKGWERIGETVGVSLAFLCPIVANAVYLWSSFGPPIDPTPLALGVSSVILALMLRRDRVREIMPVAWESVIDELRDGVLVIDGTGRVLDHNEAGRRFVVDDENGTSRPIPRLAERLAGDAVRFELVSDAIPPRFYDVHVVSLTATGLPQNVRALALRDTTHIRAAEQEVARLTSHDILTGMDNRDCFVQGLEQALANGGVVVTIGVDRFRRINQTLGHSAGDRVLRELATRLMTHVGERPRSAAASRARLARLGGDEFAAVVPGVTSTDDAKAIAEDLVEASRFCLPVRGVEISVEASAGVAVAPAHGREPELLIQRAQIAMHAAKSGHQGTSLYDPALDESARPRLSIESGLRRALEVGELEVHYQPIREARTGTVVATEAMIRWRLDGRMIAAAEFIDVAEETGLVVDIGRFVLSRACEDLAKWLRAGFGPLRVCVNRSSQEFASADLRDECERLLARHGLPAAALEIELTERALLGDDEQTENNLRALDELGVALVLDDFGTDYSSLSTLHRLPFTRVKIDRSFVARMVEEDSARRLTLAIVEMAHGLGLEVIAEGVEEGAQVEMLVEQGCDELQGYLLGRPMPREDFERILEEQALPVEI